MVVFSVTNCVSVQAQHLHSEDLHLEKLVSQTADLCPLLVMWEVNVLTVERALLVDPDGEGGAGEPVP